LTFALLRGIVVSPLEAIRPPREGAAHRLAARLQRPSA